MSAAKGVGPQAARASLVGFGSRDPPPQRLLHVIAHALVDALELRGERRGQRVGALLAERVAQAIAEATSARAG